VHLSDSGASRSSVCHAFRTHILFRIACFIITDSGVVYVFSASSVSFASVIHMTIPGLSSSMGNRLPSRGGGGEGVSL
jgi:hypothetical protein